MLWNIVNENGQELYINRDIDLKIKIAEENEEDVFFINYKGYNVASIMMLWEFYLDIDLSPIDSLRVIGDSSYNQQFVVAQKDKEYLLEEIYFFLIDNNLDSCLTPEYKVNW